MFKCFGCGHLFEDGEQGVWFEENGERIEGCPICGHSFADTESCSKCNGNFLEDELFDGVCKECAGELVTYESALDYLVDGNFLADFIFSYLWDSDTPSKVSEQLSAHLREVFLRQKANDLLCAKSDFLNLCREFILEGDGEIGISDFVSFIRKSGKG